MRALSRSLQAGQKPGQDVLWTSLVSLLLLSTFYFMTIPDHVAEFFGSWETVRRFLVIFIMNGLPTVHLVGYAAAAVMSPLAPRIAVSGPGGAARFILFDLAVRLRSS